MCHADVGIGRQLSATLIGSSHRLLLSATPIGRLLSAVGIGGAPSAVSIGSCYWQIEMVAFGNQASIFDHAGVIIGRHRYNKLIKGRQAQALK